MAKTLNLNYTDTAISGISSLNLPLSVVNFPVDFRVKVDDPGEAIVTNLTSPIERPETFRFAITEIRDVYKNTSIDANVAAPTRRGVSILCQLNDVYSITDSSDATYQVNLPMQGHIVLKIPSNDLITADVMKTFLGRLVDGLFNSGVVSSGRLASLARGSLLPDNM